VKVSEFEGEVGESFDWCDR